MIRQTTTLTLDSVDRADFAIASLGEVVGVGGSQRWHREAGRDDAAFEHRQVEIGELTIVALLEAEADAIEGKAAAARAEEIYRPREPFAQRRIGLIGAEQGGGVAQAGSGKILMGRFLFKDRSATRACGA